MNNHKKDKPDDSSIKPVSSLRAQFEDIATRKDTPPPTARKPAHLSHAEPERGRSSLDILNRTSTWTESSQIAAAPVINASTKPIPRPFTDGSHAKPRPMSMSLVSSSGFSPAVTVHPPMSPPKSGRGLVEPEHSVTRGMARSLEATKEQKAVGQPSHASLPLFTKTPELKPRLQMKSREISPSGIKKPPPPINRASKPSTPVVSSFGMELDVLDNENKDKISPFSTPPSNDESPVRETSPASQIIVPHKSDKKTSYFPAPPVHHAIESRREIISRRREDESPKRNHRTLNGGQEYLLGRSAAANRPDTTVKSMAHVQTLTDGIVPETVPIQPPRPNMAMRVPQSSKDPGSTSRKASPDYLPPPPKRNLIPGTNAAASRVSPSHTPPAMSRSNSGTPALPARGRPEELKTVDQDANALDTFTTDINLFDSPDNSHSNRRPPKTKCPANRVWTQYDTRTLDLCGNYVCTGGYVFRAWDISNSRMITDYAPEIKELKISSFIFKPGSKPDEEGLFVWIGNNVGEIQEINLKREVVLDSRPDAHGRRDIIKMFRYQNSIWSLDDEGKLLIWSPGRDGTPSLRVNPNVLRVARGHTCSIIVQNHLWIACGRSIHVYNPTAGEGHQNITLQPLTQASAAEITSAAVISGQHDTVYFSHSDGKISFYSTINRTCLGLISASPYKINCIAGAGVHLWAGFNTGMIHVYDTQSKPWKVKKEWQAHQKSPVLSIVVDLSSVWKFGHLQVASLGADNAICFWDGMLEDDWIEINMRQHDVDFCNFEEVSAAIMTWNAGASTPANLRHDQKDSNFFREAIRMDSTPDILVFGFQELIDLEDKKLTAKSIFKGSKKKDSSESEHMSHQYRVWRDYLTQLVESSMPYAESYSILHTASMVGLFTCVFVKSHLRSRIRDLKGAEIKRGLGGLHGNKGAIILRFILEDTSICFTNCHLAAGQSQTASRNADITAILEASVLSEEKDPEICMHKYIGGGDGAMIMDHEICIINGDLNYRIDTMSRDTVVKAIKSSNLAKLLERDQLLVSKRRNPGFRLRPFREQPITFVPTYKYDVGTDRFDTSEKGRSPAWCDRILYRGFGSIKQVDYKRHELKLSDHRPVSGLFMMRIKIIDQQRRAVVREQAEDRLANVREELARSAKFGYLVNIMGVQEKDAQRMLDQQ